MYVAQIARPPSLKARLRHHRHQDGDQNRNDADDDQQLYQREAPNAVRPATGLMVKLPSICIHGRHSLI
jgi:hypothetical protein